MLRLFSGMVNGEEAAEHRVCDRRSKAGAFQQLNHAGSAWIVSQRSRDVAVSIGVAMQDPAERTADGRQVEQVNGPDQRIRWPVEVERQQLSAVSENPVDFGDTDGQLRNVPQ